MTDTVIQGGGILTREHQCECGDVFEQRGIMLDLGDREAAFGWSPVRCPACIARAQAAIRATDQETRKSLLAERRRRAEFLLNVPLLYAEASLKTFELHGTPEQQEELGKVLHLARNYLTSWPHTQESYPLLLFQGPPGSGKGHLAWSIASWLVQEHTAKVRVVKLAAIIRDLREAWRDPAGPSEDQRLTAYRQLDLLVIDEVSRHAFYGKEVKQHLYDIVDDRLEQRRPTILTTNEDDDGIGEILGAALTNRLSTGGKVPFPAVDWRSRERT